MNERFNSQTIFIRKVVECRIERDNSATLKNLITKREIRTKVVTYGHPRGIVGACFNASDGCGLTFADDVSVVFRA